MMRQRLEPPTVLLATLATIIANAVPNALRLRGETTGSISAKVPTLFTPAGYAFSIWSVIYLACLAFAVFQLLPANRADPVISRIRRPFLASCVLNSTWIFVWHYELIVLSAAVIALLLASLVLCYVRLDSQRASQPRAFRAMVLAPFSLYVAWVTVATIVNVAAALVSLGWQGGPLSPASWSVVMIVVACLLALVVAWSRRDWIFLSVVAWAVVAISVAQSSIPSIRWTARVVGALLLVGAAASIARRARLAESRDSAASGAG